MLASRAGFAIALFGDAACHDRMPDGGAGPTAGARAGGAASGDGTSEGGGGATGAGGSTSTDTGPWFNGDLKGEICTLAAGPCYPKIMRPRGATGRAPVGEREFTLHKEGPPTCNFDSSHPG
jgi:hypothetical protein